MTYGGINFLSILVATIAAMAAGAVWYGYFAATWAEAAGQDKDAKPGKSSSIYAVAALAKLVMAYALARLMEVLDAVSVGNGIALALFLWIGFVFTTLSVNHRFQGRPWRLTLIDGGYWLLVLLLQAIIIGFLG